MSRRPTVGITMGDPSGIGPEIIVKALSGREVRDICCPVVIGDSARLRLAESIVGLQSTVKTVEDLRRADLNDDSVLCIDLGLVPANLPFGEPSAISGNAAYQYIKYAVHLAELGLVDAITTAPLSKLALHAAGYKFPGHTELLAALTNTDEVSMMLVSTKLRVIHVTTHMGLIDAIESINSDLVQRVITRAYLALIKAGISSPRIGVCGINPHAGEDGLFGRGEESRKIAPAVARCVEMGWDVKGPLAADTLFYLAARGDFDVVVAMYHDQGHGPIKVLGLESGVNVSVGLPVIRTSVDHGTAFDIAGRGVADERSMIEAIRQAVTLTSDELLG